jgi:hypothetical protein
MNILAPSFLLAALALTACGGAVDATDLEGFADDAEFADEGEISAEAASESSDALDAEADTQTLGSAQQPLISTGGIGGLGAKPWCAARKACYDQCDRDYTGGPRTTCKQLCDQTTASKCRPGLATGVRP